jgi:hypothetical protein
MGRATAAAALVLLAIGQSAAQRPEFRGVQLIPCKLDGSSLDCKCAKATNRVVVNCGFISFPGYQVPTQTDIWPAERQAEVQEFYLFRGTLRELNSPSPFVEMSGLTVLNMRSNALRVIHRDTFVVNSELIELNLEDNSLTSLPAGLLRNNTKLKFLRMGSNRLSALPSSFFREQVELEILHLEDNVMTSLPVDVFSINATHGLQHLREIYLANNGLTQLVGGLFANLPALKELHLQVNPDLRYIANDVFSPDHAVVSSLAQVDCPDCTLSMDGSPSYCSANVSAETIDCVCAEGFESSDVPGDHFCHPVDCGPSIQGLIEQATDSCGQDTEFGSSCEATCNDGYSGPTAANPAVFECTANASWTGAIACVPVVCSTTIDDATSTGHYSANCVGDTRFGRDPCTATCDPGYEPVSGTSNVFVCGSDPNDATSTAGRWVGNLTCQRKNCGASIVGLDSRAEYVSGTNVCDGDTSFNGTTCSVRCQAGYTTADQDYICGEDGLWVPGSIANPGTPLSCAGRLCDRDYERNDGNARSLDTNAVARCRGDISFGGDDCVLKCKPGYTNTGASQSGCSGDQCVSCGSDGKWTGNSLSCERLSCDRYMTTARQRFDALVDTTGIDCGAGPEYEDICNVQCIPGYTPTGNLPNNARFKCEANSQNTVGTWQPADLAGELSCQILDCGDIADTLDDGYATLVNDGRCILPRRWDVVGGTCTTNNQWDAVAPATRAVRCGPIPAGLPQRDVFAETVDIACSPIGWARKDAAGADVAIGSTICRTDCGNTLAGARNKDGEVGRISGADFDACDGDTGFGATCQSTCLSTDGIRASFTCGADGAWQEDLVAPTADITGQASDCISTVAVSSSTKENTAIEAVTYLVPFIVLIIIIIVLLYYFEYLSCLGLAVGKKRPGQKKAPKIPKKQKTVTNAAVTNSTEIGGFALPMAL